MAVKNNGFHDPFDFGCRDIGTSQSVPLSMTFDQPVVVPKIVYVSDRRAIMTLTEANGLTVSTDRLRVDWTINGQDFSKYQNVSIEMSFFVTGTVEYAMNLKILRTHV